MILFEMIRPLHIILLLSVFLVPILPLIDVIRNDFTKNNKIIWVLLILFTGLLGTLLYLIFGIQQKIKQTA